MTPTPEQINEAKKDITHALDRHDILNANHNDNNFLSDIIVSAILALTSEPEKEWPQQGEKVWFFYSDGAVSHMFWDDHETALFRNKLGTVFKTEEEARARAEGIRSGDLIVKYVKRGE